MNDGTPACYVRPTMPPAEKAWGNLCYSIGGNSNSGSTPFGDYYGVAFAGGVGLAAFVLLWAFFRRRK